MKFYCEPHEGTRISPDIASANIKKALLEGEDLILHEVGDGSYIFSIKNIKGCTRKRVRSVLHTASGINFAEFIEEAA